MPMHSTLNDAQMDVDGSTAGERQMQHNFEALLMDAAHGSDLPLTQQELDTLPRLAPIARAVRREAEVYFVENDDGVLEARYPERTCAEDAASTAATDGDDKDDQPPAYAPVTSRYALVVPDIVQDDLGTAQQHPGVVARYVPPALRDVKNAPALMAKDPLTMHERLSAIDFALRNPLRTMNRIDALSTEARNVMDAVLTYVGPTEEDNFHVNRIAVIKDARPRYHGIDYDVRHTNGHDARLRDIDVWRSANGRMMLSLFWGNPKRVIPYDMIVKLIATPQYSDEDGWFLRRMKANVESGAVRAPKRAG
ncbi:hypothetical protein AURDEDRAFT_130392 [Auricularia subglabra TFB-10046 SS5]|nr:hypothetical protein AURDEDRAFT_130392 [Auricularia subglabra TFB-10046 SS5]